MKSNKSPYIESKRKAWKSRKNNKKKREERNKKQQQLEVHSSTGTTSPTTTIYYPIYRGWSVDFTACFYRPEFALIWCRWMLWKDMILHYWYGKDTFSIWHSCVGRCNVKSSSLLKVEKVNGIWGDFTRKLFHGVDVMKTMDSDYKNHDILICNDHCYNECLSFLNHILITNNLLDQSLLEATKY